MRSRKEGTLNVLRKLTPTSSSKPLESDMLCFVLDARKCRSCGPFEISFLAQFLDRQGARQIALVIPVALLKTGFGGTGLCGTGFWEGLGQGLRHNFRTGCETGLGTERETGFGIRFKAWGV